VNPAPSKIVTEKSAKQVQAGAEKIESESKTWAKKSSYWTAPDQSNQTQD
jgi:hypothetical protein